MQLSIMTHQLSIAALSQHPSLGSRDEAVPWTRDAHFPAGIREVLLPCWESLPIFLLPLARLLGQLTRGSLCLVSTQHGNADQGCLAFRDRQENMGVGKSLLPCRAGAGHATGITQSSARGGLWVLGTLAHCWGTGAGLAAPGTGEGRRGTMSHVLVFPEPGSATVWHESLTLWQSSARCTWHHPAQTLGDHPIHMGTYVARSCPEVKRGKLPAPWLIEDLFHLSSDRVGMQKPWMRSPWLSGWARSPHPIP